MIGYITIAGIALFVGLVLATILRDEESVGPIVLLSLLWPLTLFGLSAYLIGLLFRKVFKL